MQVWKSRYNVWEKEKRSASCACARPGPGTRCWDAGCFLLLAGAASCRLLRLLGTTGGWTNYSSCVQQMWNMLEVGGRGKYSTHSTSRAALPSQLGPKIAVGKHSHLVFGLVEEQSWFQCQDEFWGVSRFDEENCSDLVWEIQSWGE